MTVTTATTKYHHALLTVIMHHRHYCLAALIITSSITGPTLSPAMFHEVELAMTTNSANPELQSLALHLLYQVILDGKGH